MDRNEILEKYANVLEQVKNCKDFTHVVCTTKEHPSIPLEGFIRHHSEFEEKYGEHSHLIAIHLFKHDDNFRKMLGIPIGIHPIDISSILYAEYNDESQLMEQFFSIHREMSQKQPILCAADIKVKQI